MADAGGPSLTFRLQNREPLLQLSGGVSGLVTKTLMTSRSASARCHCLEKWVISSCHLAGTVQLRESIGHPSRDVPSGSWGWRGLVVIFLVYREENEAGRL